MNIISDILQTQLDTQKYRAPDHMSIEQREEAFGFMAELDDKIMRIEYINFQTSLNKEDKARHEAQRKIFRDAILGNHNFIAIGQAANDAYIAGEIDQDEWINRLRWTGMDCRKGFTKLNPDEETQRLANLKEQEAAA